MKKIILLSLSLLLFVSCSKDGEKSPGIQYHDTIMPLAVGNYWVFADTTFQDPYLISETSKISISGYSNIKYNSESFPVYHWNWYDMPEDVPQQRKNLVRNEAEGLFYYGQKIGSSLSEIDRKMFIKFPVNPAAEWNYTGGLTIKCLSTSTLFPTPLGDIECYVYELIPDTREGYRIMSALLGYDFDTAERDNEETLLYYSPEIGYVGMTVNGGTENFVRTLTDFRAQTPPVRTASPDLILSP
jgi:hypothetical protein